MSKVANKYKRQWLNQPYLKKKSSNSIMLYPRIQVENKKYLSCHHPEYPPGNEETWDPPFTGKFGTSSTQKGRLKRKGDM